MPEHPTSNLVNRLPLLAFAAMLAFASPGPRRLRFSGTARAGAPFSRNIGHGLKLVVTTDKIKIQPKAAEGKPDDYTRCVSPPFHGPNPTDLGSQSFLSESGLPLTESELAARRNREFYFVLTSADQEKACRQLDTVLYGPHKRLRDGTIVMGTPDYVSPPLGTGILTIKDFQILGVACNHSGPCEPEVRSIAFDIEIALPVGH